MANVIKVRGVKIGEGVPKIIVPIVGVVIGGGVLLVMFGDVIVFVAIVALIVKLVRRRRCRN